MQASIQKYLNQFLPGKLGLEISSLQFHSIGGGSINDTYQVIINRHIRFFLKLNSAAKYPALFQKEKKGLEFLGKQKIIYVPSVIVLDELAGSQILLLEWIEGGLKTGNFWKQFGKQLAALHHVTSSHFGFEEDNYMGALPQRNDQQKNWVGFFIHHRLQPQIEMAGERHLLQGQHLDAFSALYSKLNDIFNHEEPSLVHGDLWSGNFMCNQTSEPVLIDPAVYFGHRSVDLAMTTLFGGFDKLFYESYHYYFPFPRNYHEQWEICNLYPLLIHLNLFGSGYLGQIESILRRFK
jgi:protein-ribulosamine 3-kinase